MIVSIVFAGLTAISLVINFWQFVAAWRFPMGVRRAPAPQAPGVTLLKPVKGCDATTAESFRSWFRQDYRGPVQVLFAVRDPDDPVCPIVRNLIAEHPGIDAELVVCPELLGANAKVSSLAHLESRIRHEVVVVSDADVRIAADLVTQIVAWLAQPEIGMVNCFYRLANPSNLAMHWEAYAVNADFWSQVLQSRTLQAQDFALGAVMATTRKCLAAVGGFRALVNHLADDYHLGNRIAKLGERIELCTVPVDCWDGPAGWSQVWAHQLRWSRTIRVCQPLPYFASVLSNLTLWTVLLIVALVVVPGTGFSPATLGSLKALAGIALGWRLLSANLLFARLCGRYAPVGIFWMPWMKDLLGFVVWVASFAGHTVEWRGIRYRVGRDGQLTPLE